MGCLSSLEKLPSENLDLAVVMCLMLRQPKENIDFVDHRQMIDDELV